MNKASLCPLCNEPTTYESVDIGVGIMYGPEYCVSCGWSEYHNAGKVIDGWYYDITGTAHNVDRIVENATRLGGDKLGELVREHFMDKDEIQNRGFDHNSDRDPSEW